MKNIHILPTDKPSRLGYLTKKGKEVFNDLRLFEKPMPNILDSENQHISITSDEEIKEGDWFHYRHFGEDIISKADKNTDLVNINNSDRFYQKIILITDQDLIKDGVQEIDDEFLEWFVKNPSCEFVKTDLVPVNEFGSEITVGGYGFDKFKYKIIIPQEEPKQECCQDVSGFYLGTTCPKCNTPFRSVIQEPKQETLEEAAERLYPDGCDGTNRSAEIYRRIFIDGAKLQAERMYSEEDLLSAFEAGMMFIGEDKGSFREWFEQFKKTNNGK
jgi:hypothetical protein